MIKREEHVSRSNMAYLQAGSEQNPAEARRLLLESFGAPAQGSHPVSVILFSFAKSLARYPHHPTRHDNIWRERAGSAALSRRLNQGHLELMASLRFYIKLSFFPSARLSSKI